MKQSNRSTRRISVSAALCALALACSGSVALADTPPPKDTKTTDGKPVKRTEILAPDSRVLKDKKKPTTQINAPDNRMLKDDLKPKEKGIHSPMDYLAKEEPKPKSKDD